MTLNMGSSYDAEASAGMSMRRSGQMVDDLLDSGGEHFRKFARTKG